MSDLDDFMKKIDYAISGESDILQSMKEYESEVSQSLRSAYITGLRMARGMAVELMNR